MGPRPYSPISFGGSLAYLSRSKVITDNLGNNITTFRRNKLRILITGFNKLVKLKGNSDDVSSNTGNRRP